VASQSDLVTAQRDLDATLDALAQAGSAERPNLE